MGKEDVTSRIYELEEKIANMSPTNYNSDYVVALAQLESVYKLRMEIWKIQTGIWIE